MPDSFLWFSYQDMLGKASEDIPNVCPLQFVLETQMTNPTSFTPKKSTWLQFKIDVCKVQQSQEDDTLLFLLYFFWPTILFPSSLASEQLKTLFSQHSRNRVLSKEFLFSFVVTVWLFFKIISYFLPRHSELKATPFKGQVCTCTFTKTQSCHFLVFSQSLIMSSWVQLGWSLEVGTQYTTPWREGNTLLEPLFYQSALFLQIVLAKSWSQ